MGVAILCIVIGVPLGLFMLLRPRKIWWATESWKYKNPEANEPSEAAYGMQALGGLFVIVAAFILAWLAWSTERDKEASEAEQKKKDDWNAAVAAYQPPKPEDRGALPIIGYVEKSQGSSPRVSLEVYYLQPPNVVESGFKEFMHNPKGRYQCVTHVSRYAPAGVNPAPITANLSWEPDVPQVDNAASDACTTRDIGQSNEIKSQPYFLNPGVQLVTDSPIVDAHGKVLAPAKPGNMVPKLDGAPRR
ncbi:DUF6199 family natural product biosynthesis protein [Mycolicibacterium neworleansense]|uniref:DUF6199 domain-containing protein n=1 Tax=Mycolicibacterium neworleansense TaxID=146018 RepID=A0A0H5S3H0_9MYCO|nr:DUF6199 family natural product biosynthesis protein [Mycolicibacterium neworleansense]MCV7364870.1 hypothetical protein [Mycolicibacterium neworleansense]CRZ15664.1 hypothetical protein BN2156_02527 [Mycolicibacterium neworleansense]